MKIATITLLLFQLGCLSLIVGGLWVMSLFGCDQAIVLSGVLGGLIFILPNTYFSHYAFRHTQAREAKGDCFATEPLKGPEIVRRNRKRREQFIKVARSFYWGEVGKFVLTVMSFAVIFRFFPSIDALSLFSVFGVMTVLHWWLASAVTKRLEQAL